MEMIKLIQNVFSFFSGLVRRYLFTKPIAAFKVLDCEIENNS